MCRLSRVADEAYPARHEPRLLVRADGLSSGRACVAQPLLSTIMRINIVRARPRPPGGPVSKTQPLYESAPVAAGTPRPAPPAGRAKVPSPPPPRRPSPHRARPQQGLPPCRAPARPGPHRRRPAQLGQHRCRQGRAGLPIQRCQQCLLLDQSREVGLGQFVRRHPAVEVGPAPQAQPGPQAFAGVAHGAGSMQDRARPLGLAARQQAQQRRRANAAAGPPAGAARPAPLLRRVTPGRCRACSASQASVQANGAGGLQRRRVLGDERRQASSSSSSASSPLPVDPAPRQPGAQPIGSDPTPQRSAATSSIFQVRSR